MTTQARQGNIRSRAVLSLFAAVVLWAQICLAPSLARADDGQELKRQAVSSQTSWAGFAFLAALLSGIVKPPKVHKADGEDGKHPVAKSSANYRVPDVKLVDENGKQSSLRANLDSGGPVMLNFVFTACTDICPTVNSTFSQVQAKLDADGKPVKMVSIFVDPANDTPAMLQEYAKKYKAGPNWKMLTGPTEKSVTVQRAFDVYQKDKQERPPVTFLRAKKGKPWVRLEGLASAGDLIKEYHQLMARGN